MKAKMAIATASGKAYFLIVNELKEKNIRFLSLIPGDPVPAEVKVVITTEKEKHLINHEKILAYDESKAPSIMINEAVKILQGKELYEKITIGIDPGEVFGLAVVADGKITETENCFSIQEALSKIRNIIKNTDTCETKVSVKIGNGVPAFKQLLEELDSVLPLEVVLELVSEAGTNRHISENKQRRGLRDIVSAIRIAGRAGSIYLREKRHESNS